MPVRPEEKIRCSFCGKNQDQVRKMIAGTNGVYICDECIELCSEILEEELGNEEEERPDFSGINLLKPKEIKEFLDDYVIGQDEAKKVRSNRIRQDLSCADTCEAFRCSVCNRRCNDAD